MNLVQKEFKARCADKSPVLRDEIELPECIAEDLPEPTKTSALRFFRRVTPDEVEDWALPLAPPPPPPVPNPEDDARLDLFAR